MSIKKGAHEIVDNLSDDASWDDLVKSLYMNQKITLGMTDLEAVQRELSEADVAGIMKRLNSSNSQPNDKFNTRKYQPGNATTLGMVTGIVAILFAFVFPPIAWFSAVVAAVAGAVGVKKKEDNAWVPILLAMVSLVPLLIIFQN